MTYLAKRPIRRSRLGDTPLDYLRNALPSWAGGMQITPNQAAEIAAQTPGGMTADQILAYNQKNPAFLPGDENSMWAKLTSNAGGTGNPNWGVIGFGTIAWIVGAGVLGIWALPKIARVLAK